MADGSIVIDTEVNNKKAQAELNRLGNKINKLNEALSGNKGKQSAIKTELEGAKKEALKTEQTIKKLKAELSETYAITSGQVKATPNEFIDATVRQPEITQQLQEQEALLKQQDKETQRLDAQYAKITDTVIRQSDELSRAKSEADRYTAKLAKTPAAVQKLGPAMESAQKSARRFGLRIREVVRSALVFTLITQALAKFREWMGKVIKSNAEASAAVAKLKGALLTLAQPLVEVIIPAFTAFVNILAKVVSAIASVLASIFGTTIEGSAQAAENMYEEQNAIEGVGNAAKKASKSLASFDEINKLSGESNGGAGGSSSSGIAPDFSSVVKDSIGSIYAVLIGAAAALVIGAILTFTGVNIPLGLGLMAIGAVVLGSAIAANWGTMDTQMKSALTKILIGLAAFSLVIGLILALSGVNLPLGIALIAIGAVSLASAVGLNWETLKSQMQGTLGGMIAFVGVSLVIIGLMLSLTGVAIPLGIALIAVGAVALASVVALNWEKIKTLVRENLGSILVITGIALVTIGLILSLTGVALPLGIGLIAAGAVALGSAAALKWGEFTESINSEMKKLSGLFVGVGVALVVLGLILIFTGVGIPLGLGLLAAGGVSLAAAIAPNWDEFSGTLIEKIKEVMGWFEKVKNVIQSAIDKLKEFFQMGANENQNMIINNTPGLRTASYSLPKSNIPLLAQGAVIPPNRQFLAMLGDQKSGTNIEAPLATIEQALFNALNRAGYGGQGEAVLEVDGQQFGKLVYRYGNKENRRIGVSLVGR